MLGTGKEETPGPNAYRIDIGVDKTRTQQQSELIFSLKEPGQNGIVSYTYISLNEKVV